MNASSPIGRTIAGRYRISRSIGEDAFGLRFVGRDTTSRKQISILLLRPQIAAAHPARLAELGDRLQAVEHPSIVRLLHHEVNGNDAVRVTEWDAGGTLGAQLSDVPLMSSSVRWCQDLAEALSVAHTAGLLHGGIAPSAIRIVRQKEPPGLARLDDWGLARLLHTTGDPLTSTGLHFTGGAAWLAPESIRGNKADARADLYALGAVLFHSLTGRPPFSGPELKVLAAHVNDAAPAPSQHISGVPHWLDELVLALLAKDPRDRPQTAREVADALQAGSAELHDGAAHPARVTANVAPTRLPNVALRGTAAHAPPRLDRISGKATPLPPSTTQQWVLGLLLSAIVGMLLATVALLLRS